MTSEQAERRTGKTTRMIKGVIGEMVPFSAAAYVLVPNMTMMEVDVGNRLLAECRERGLAAQADLYDNGRYFIRELGDIILLPANNPVARRMFTSAVKSGRCKCYIDHSCYDNDGQELADEVFSQMPMPNDEWRVV